MPKLGTSLRISRIYLSMGIEDKKLDDLDMNDLLKLQAMHGSKIALLVAHVILNGYWSGKILARPLAAWLKWRMPIRSLYTIMQMVVLHGGTADFLNTIRLTRHLKMTEPNLSQETERS
ncbi:hypothetical protein [Solitalea koreensis]|nr:hypothetical protein [Solitalea koreensis]